MKLILALMIASATATANPLSHPLHRALHVKGGASVGPLTSKLAGDIGKMVTGVTVGSAVLEKYGGMGSTTLGKFMTGDLFTTNAVVTLVASCASKFFVGTCASGFDPVKLTAALWITSLGITLKNDGVSADTVMANREATVIAALLGFMAFVE